MRKSQTNGLERRTNGPTEEVALTADFGTVFIKRTESGQYLRPIKAKLTLFEKAKHFYWIAGSYAISASGYTHLNKVSSINLITPKTVSVDGREQPNPYVERGRNKLIETVNVRKIGIGYSPVGNITVIDKTLFYNIYTYFIESLQSKMKKQEYKNGQPTGKLLYPDCAEVGHRLEKPKKPGKWAFFEIASPIGIWADYTHPAIIACLEDHTQRQRFGDRIAQKIVERNILKDHPAIGISHLDDVTGEQGKRKGNVTVFGFRHEFGPRDISDIASQAERGDQEIEVKAEVVRVDPEEESEVIRETADEETPATMEEPPSEWYEQKKREENGKS
jgi:hypothetical protein